MNEARTDGFSRHARWLLAGALLIAGGSIGYRLYADRAVPAHGEVAPATPAPAAGATLTQLEARTRDKPDDVARWQALGWGYFDAQRYADAVRAYTKATALSPGAAILWSSLGEALVMASDHEPMPVAALDAFRKSHDLDAKDPRARYFLAVARDLAGDHEGAIGDWLALLGETPPGAPWETDLRRTIEQVGKINKIDTATRLAAVKQPAGSAPSAAQGIPGPSREQMAAASAMTPTEQRQMAEGMVAQLEQKLKADPGNIERWTMLIRSRVTLNQPDKARTALADAIHANPRAAQALRAQAAVLGVK